MKVAREFHIDSSHVLPGHPKCGVLHGHTYRIDVVLEGDDSKSMVMDFDEIRTKVDAFIEHLDHRHLNDVLEMPTVENLARYLHEGLKAQVPELAAIRVWEGLGKYAEYEPGSGGKPAGFPASAE